MSQGQGGLTAPPEPSPAPPEPSQPLPEPPDPSQPLTEPPQPPPRALTSPAPGPLRPRRPHSLTSALPPQGLPPPSHHPMSIKASPRFYWLSQTSALLPLAVGQAEARLPPPPPPQPHMAAPGGRPWPEAGEGSIPSPNASPSPATSPSIPEKRGRRGHGTILPAQRPCEGGRQGRAVNRPAVITG